jgi:hypothetical protein
MLLIHEALRRETCAAAALDHWRKQYRANPTDDNAARMHLAWIELREAVDELVQLPSVLRYDEVALAVTTEDVPERRGSDNVSARDAVRESGTRPGEAPPPRVPERTDP